MAAIKSYTTVEESRKLAEILPLDSADMAYIWHATSDNPTFRFDDDMPPMVLKDVPIEDITADTLPCWSLAALFDVLPKFIGDYGKCLYYDVGGYYCGYMVDGKFMLTIEETKADNPVDCCVEMILKLNEQHLL